MKENSSLWRSAVIFKHFILRCSQISSESQNEDNTVNLLHMFNQIASRKSLHWLFIRRTCYPILNYIKLSKGNLVMRKRFMCELTYDNLTICIEFHEDLCECRTAAAEERKQVSSVLSRGRCEGIESWKLSNHIGFSDLKCPRYVLLSLTSYCTR